jgi:F0F1-type ATP synthase membrane subunit b/b'
MFKAVLAGAKAGAKFAPKLLKAGAKSGAKYGKAAAKQAGKQAKKEARAIAEDLKNNARQMANNMKASATNYLDNQKRRIYQTNRGAIYTNTSGGNRNYNPTPAYENKPGSNVIKPI